jgi:hypothetical protein
MQWVGNDEAGCGIHDDLVEIGASLASARIDQPLKSKVATARPIYGLHGTQHH